MYFIAPHRALSTTVETPMYVDTSLLEQFDDELGLGNTGEAVGSYSALCEDVIAMRGFYDVEAEEAEPEDIGPYRHFFAPYDGSVPQRVLVESMERALLFESPPKRDFGLFSFEEEFLKQDAIPRIIEMKLAEAQAKDLEEITVTVKSLGIGAKGTELLLVSRLLRAYYQRWGVLDVRLKIVLMGGDISLENLEKVEQRLTRRAGAGVRKKHKGVETSVQVKLFYADLTNGDLIDAIINEGEPDITLWRHTWIAFSKKTVFSAWERSFFWRTADHTGGKLSYDEAVRFIYRLRRASNPGGVLIVSETLGTKDYKLQTFV